VDTGISNKWRGHTLSRELPVAGKRDAGSESEEYRGYLNLVQQMAGPYSVEKTAVGR
jgi:hypothetical protein